MKQVNLEELYKIISESSLVESNYDIVTYIYKFYKIPYPKFKLNELCIRLYPSGIKQAVTIDSLSYIYNTYLYEYSYYPCSDGFCSENSLKKLTEEEIKLKDKSIFLLPMQMSPECLY